MPTHVRAVDLPTGIYWNRARRNWYTFVDGKRVALVVVNEEPAR